MSTTLAAPANSITTITPLSTGALRLSGWGAVFHEVDRQGDRWTPEAVEGHADRFMQGARELRFNHRRDLPAVGVVDDLALSSDGYGVRATATLAYYPPGHELRPIWEGVLSRVVDSFSFGAYFTRQALPDGTNNLIRAELTELSVTGRPVGYSTRAAVVGVGDDPFDDPDGREWLSATRRTLGLR